MKHLVFITLLFLMAGCATSPITPEQKATKPQTESQTITIGAVGDIFLGGTSTTTVMDNGYDHPFTETKPLYANADIVIGNLEGPLTSRGSPAQNKRFVYRTPAHKVTPALKNAGFHIVTLANNHSMDYGITGLQDTIRSLEEHHIAHIGAGETLQSARRAYVFQSKGLKIGFLGYSLTFPEEFWANQEKGGTAFAREKQLRDDLRLLRNETDAIVVSFHWGRELQTELRPYQSRMGRMAIDEGAALVIGHHPHIMQGIEAYKHGLILYSLGNYTFGSYSNRVQYGGIANVELDSNGFRSLELSIIDINNFRQQFQPKPMKNKRLQHALHEVKELSKVQNTVLSIQGEKLTLTRRLGLHQNL